MVHLQTELNAVITHAEKMLEESDVRLHATMGNKEGEIGDLILQQQQIREEKVRTLEATAENEQAMPVTLEEREATQKQAQEALAKAEKAEKEKCEVKTAFLLDDYLRGNGPCNTLEPKHEFNMIGEIEKKVDGFLNDMESVRFLRNVKPNMHDKIVNNFVSMGDILYDTVTIPNLKTAEQLNMRTPKYL